jgi:SNF2 family DNA or RNA helicase
MAVLPREPLADRRPHAGIILSGTPLQNDLGEFWSMVRTCLHRSE